MEQCRGRGRKRARSVVFLKPKRVARTLSTHPMVKTEQPKSRTKWWGYLGSGGEGPPAKKMLRQ